MSDTLILGANMETEGLVIELQGIQNQLLKG